MSRLPAAFARHLRPASQPATRARPAAPAGIDEAIKRAAELRDKGEMKAAEKVCVSILTRDPRNVKALLLAGSLAGSAGDISLAIELFKKAVGCAPGSADCHLQLALAYEEALDYSASSEHFTRALDIEPDLMPALRGLGRVYVGAGQIELAIAQFEKATMRQPDSAILRLDYASALINVGRMGEAADLLRANIAQDALSISSYFWLAQTQKFSSEPAELSIILAKLNEPGLSAQLMWNLHQTAGKILNDLGRYDEAVDQIQAGKLAVSADYDVGEFRRTVDTLIAAFTPDLLKSKAGLGDPSEVPVFIVGMPRSGTSLTEQICASHPAVYGAGELIKLQAVLKSGGYANKPNGEIQKHPMSLTAAEARSLARRYLDFLKDRAPGTARIIDKLPHNFQCVGMIALLFPNARIIHCRRNAIDNCVSIFFQAFANTHAYSNTLETLGLYYREYDRLMRHWNALLPGRIYESSYEALIADQEGESRKLIDFLGLPWDDACLRYYEADRSVLTASRWQVRQPIYHTSVKSWKKYENKIQPLIEALGDLADV